MHSMLVMDCRVLIINRGAADTSSTLQAITSIWCPAKPCFFGRAACNCAGCDFPRQFKKHA